MHVPRPTRRAMISRRGFSLLELLIVIGIILAIGGLVAVNLLGQQERADSGTTRIQMQNLARGLDDFKVDMKRYPSDEEGIAVPPRSRASPTTSSPSAPTRKKAPKTT